MNPRIKKAIGTVVILAWIILYAGGAGAVGAMLIDAPQAVQLVYYVVAGLAWIIPLKPLFGWMNRQPAGADQSF